MLKVERGKKAGSDNPIMYYACVHVPCSSMFPVPTPWYGPPPTQELHNSCTTTNGSTITTDAGSTLYYQPPPHGGGGIAIEDGRDHSAVPCMG